MKHNILIAFIFLMLITGATLAGPGDLDTTFAGTGKIRVGFKTGDDEANGVVTQPDGKLVVVGSTPNGDSDFLIIRYNTDGSFDTSFGGDGKVTTHFGRGEDVAMGVALQPDGKIVVTGHCTGANVDVCTARYNTDGSLDSQFGIAGTVVTPITTSWDYGRGVAIQADGKIVVVGDSLTNNQSADMIVIRYHANGSLDNNFGTNQGYAVTNVVQNGTDVATAVAIQPDGKIVVAGYGSPFLSPEFMIVARYTTSGQPDGSWWLNGIGMYRFTDTGDHRAYSVTVQPDGKVVMAGVAQSKFAVVRFTSVGLFDNTFNGNGRIMTSVGGSYDEARAVMVNGSNVTVAGLSSTGARKDFAVARFTLGGAPDTNFNGTGKLVMPIGAGDSKINAVALQAGAIAVAGSSYNGSNRDIAVARYTAFGTSDNSFDNDGRRIDNPGTRYADGRDMVVQPDGKIIVAGSSDTDATGLDFAVSRYNANGSMDSSFGENGHATTDFGSNQDEAYALALAPDGKIVVAGSRFDQSANTFDFAIARYNSNGTPDNTFNGTGELVLPVGTFSDVASGVAVQPDGKILVAGSTNVTPDLTDFAVVRLNVNGSMDNSFGQGGKAITAVGVGNDEAKSVRVQADGKIVVAGSAYNGPNADFAVVRYTAGGITDNQFGSFGRQITPIGAAMDQGFGMTLQADGKILVAGYTINAEGNSAQMAVVRYGTNGLPDSSFDMDGIVTTAIGPTISLATDVAVQTDGKIVVGGAAALGTAIEFAAARYHTNGALDDTYGIGGKIVVDVSGDNDIGWAVAIDGQGRTLIAGDAQSLVGIARLQGDLVPRKAPLDFDADGKTDVSIFRPGPAEWWVMRSSNGGNFAAQFGQTTDKIVPADFTGDGKTDIAFFRPSSGQWFVLRSEDSSFFAFPFGANGDVPVPADYDGDGKADAAVFRPSNSTWFIRRSSDGGTTISQFGAASDQPVPADYDGDGKTDIAIRRPNNGQWWLNRSSAGVIALSFGSASDRTVQGDYTGDGKSDVAVWRPSTGQWFVLRSEDLSFYSFPFGTNGDVPSPGDYDGDGKFDATVYRPTGSTWFVNKSGGGVLTIPFGATGDQPLPAAFVR